jgi:hypothetical protein
VRRGALSDATAALPSAAWSARRTPPPLQFSVSLAPDQYLELDDVVVTVRPVAGIGPVLTAGGGTEGRACQRSLNFGSGSGPLCVIDLASSGCVARLA